MRSRCLVLFSSFSSLLWTTRNEQYNTTDLQDGTNINKQLTSLRSSRSRFANLGDGGRTRRCLPSISARRSKRHFLGFAHGSFRSTTSITHCFVSIVTLLELGIVVALLSGLGYKLQVC